MNRESLAFSDGSVNLLQPASGLSLKFGKLGFNPLHPQVMEAFDPTPPPWTEQAKHAFSFCCPRCGASSYQAQRVWINRRAPVISEDYRRKWQEFYECDCGQVWWAWSSDRPPSDLINSDQ